MTEKKITSKNIGSQELIALYKEAFPVEEQLP